jgi:riboflavin synthase
MFTGIIEEIGVVSEITPTHLTVSAKKVLGGTQNGDSISINGVCLTVTTLKTNSFSVDIMPETIRRTNLSRLHYNDQVNLERAVMVGGRLGGHYVQGHVDDTGRILSVKPEGPAVIVRMSAPNKLLRYIVNKGFIAVDGASLTVVEADGFSFSVSLVEYTQKQITLAKKKTGDVINLEVDIIAKYVERLKQNSSQEVMLDFLEENDLSKMR